MVSIGNKLVPLTGVHLSESDSKGHTLSHTHASVCHSAYSSMSERMADSCLYLHSIKRVSIIVFKTFKHIRENVSFPPCQNSVVKRAFFPFHLHTLHFSELSLTV